MKKAIIPIVIVCVILLVLLVVAVVGGIFIFNKVINLEKNPITI